MLFTNLIIQVIIERLDYLGVVDQHLELAEYLLVLLLACALCVLYKANADDVRDEALHAECKRIEWWCAQFVRHLGGGPASSSPAGVMDCVVADLRAGGEDDQKAQLREEMGRLVRVLRAEPLRPRRRSLPALRR